MVEHFQVWNFTVSHDQLLIRKRHRDKETNHDIYFTGVVYFELPSIFEEVAIEEPEEKDYVYIATRTTSEYKNLYVLRIEGKKYYVAAAHMCNEENSLEIYEIPFEGGLIPKYKNENCDMDFFFDIFMQSYEQFKNSEDYLLPSDEKKYWHMCGIVGRYGNVFAGMKRRENLVKLIPLLANPRDAFNLSFAVKKIAQTGIPEMEPLLRRYTDSEKITDEELGLDKITGELRIGDFIRKELKMMAIDGLKYYQTKESIDKLSELRNDEDFYVREAANRSLEYFD